MVSAQSRYEMQWTLTEGRELVMRKTLQEPGLTIATE